jgi:hypothetical protein
MPRKARNHVGKATYDRRDVPPLSVRTTGDRGGQVDQGRIESCRLYDEIEAHERPQAPN